MNRLKKSYSSCMMCGGKKMKSGGNWIKKAISKPGAFTAQAKKAGMSVPAFRDKVLSNKEAYSSTTVKRANLAKTLSKMRKGAEGMLEESAATPGPFMQKIMAGITRAKYSANSALNRGAGAVNQAAGVVGSDISSRIENAQSSNTLPGVEAAARVSARRAERDKRRYERNVSSPNAPMFRGENLPGNRRQAIRAISENLDTKAQGRERMDIARTYYENLNKPTTDAEMRKRNAKLQSNAVMGPSGFGAGTGSGPSALQMQTVCPLTGGCGGRKGMLVKKKVQPLSSYRKK